MQTQAETLAEMKALNVRLDAQNEKIGILTDGIVKVGGETTGLKASIARLEELLANQGNVDPAVTAELEAMKLKVGAQEERLATAQARLKEVDEQVDDPVVEPPPVEPPVDPAPVDPAPPEPAQ